MDIVQKVSLAPEASVAAMPLSPKKEAGVDDASRYGTRMPRPPVLVFAEDA